MLKPGGVFPDLSFSRLDAAPWALREARRELTLISVIRGYFCTYCHDGMRDLEQAVDAFNAIDIDVLATSTDDALTAADMKEKLGLDCLAVGYGLTEADIRQLGLFATVRNDKFFAEPAILIARRDGSVYAVFQNSISCGRTDIARLLEGLKLLAPTGFPLRGNA